MKAKSTTTVEVEIFGATYHVRGGNEPEYLQELAFLVDRKMQEVATHVETVDRTKIAILAALNIADELVRARADQDGGGGAEATLEKMTEDLNEALQR